MLTLCAPCRIGVLACLMDRLLRCRLRGFARASGAARHLPAAGHRGTCVECGPVLIHAEPCTGYLTQTDTWIGYVS